MRRGTKAYMLAGMDKRITLHIIDSDSRSRAETSRLVFGLGHHAEVYSSLEELLDHPPREGILLVCQSFFGGRPKGLMARLAAEGVWLPVIATSMEPTTEVAVQAIKAGMLDYLQLPLDELRLERSVRQVQAEAAAHSQARRKLIDARRRLERLSRREREVLDWLAHGYSNKNIARELGISPRTVEIHRAHMMEKLQACHSADAVRVRLEAEVDDLETCEPRRLAS